MAGQAWPKSARLRRRREFLEVQGKGLKVSGQWLTALVRHNRRGVRRLGITVSTKVGNAVIRTRVKRWLREAYRRNASWVPEGLDLVLIARPGIDVVGYAAVLKDLERVARALRAKVPGPSAERSR